MKIEHLYLEDRPNELMEAVMLTKDFELVVERVDISKWIATNDPLGLCSFEIGVNTYTLLSEHYRATVDKQKFDNLYLCRSYSTGGWHLGGRNKGDEPIKYANSLIQLFNYKHLPKHLQEVSKQFHILATTIDSTMPNNPEKSTALRKLREAKDCAITATFFDNAY